MDNTETLGKGMSQDTLLETVKKTHRLIPITNLLFVDHISSVYREDCSNSLTHLVFLEHFMFVCLILHFKKVGKKLEFINQI